MAVTIIRGDVRDVLPTLQADSFDCIVTSPPYWGLRDYGCDGQIGLEPMLDEYLETMVVVCRELHRVLKPSGVFFLNIGDSYAGSWGAQSREYAGKHVPNISALHANQVKAARRRGGARKPEQFSTLGLKPKDLCLAPERLGIALQADGWWVRSKIIWHKPNPMPESVSDRPTSAHETIWMLTKSARYIYLADAVAEGCSPTSHYSLKAGAGKKQESIGQNLGGNLAVLPESGTRNCRDVWTIATQRYTDAHFATMPRELAVRCIKGGCPPGGHVLDPFGGVGTTGLVADRLGRDATLIEINSEYAAMATERINTDAPLFVECHTSDEMPWPG